MGSDWRHYMHMNFFIFKLCVACICGYVHVDTCTSWHECEGQKTTCVCWFFVTSMCVPRIKFRSSGFPTTSWSCWAILLVLQSFYYHILLIYNNGIQYDIFVCALSSQLPSNFYFHALYHVCESQWASLRPLFFLKCVVFLPPLSQEHNAVR